MQIDWWTLGLQTINLLVLIFILSRFLFRPVTEIIRQRQAAAEDVLKKAEAERVRAEAREQQADEERAAIEKTRDRLLQTAVTEAEDEKARILAEARSKSKELLENGKEEIDKWRRQAQQQHGEMAIQLAIRLTAKLLERLPASVKTDGFVDGLVQAVNELPERTREEMTHPPAMLKLRSATSLTHGQKAACKVALEKALGRTAKIQFEADPELIAGLELDGTHAIVRNSFSADLQRIAKELVADARS